MARTDTGADLDTAGEATADPEQSAVGAATPEARSRFRPQALTLLRWAALVTWAVVVGSYIVRYGITYDRNTLLLVLCSGLFAATLGRRRSITVLRDWLPFALVLVVYDLSRGAASLVGRPTEWHLQIDFDRGLFLGHEPTVWLQSHLKEPYPPWWETVVSLVYVSFFFAPYVAAGVLWLRDRAEWRKFVLRFVVISFIGLAGFIAFPAAPPWAAALCESSEVQQGPSDPPCMSELPSANRYGGMLGQVKLTHTGAAPWIERISTRGWDKLGVPQAKALINEGQAGVNQVAAVPSLHAAISMLITVFFWPRVRKRWRPLLAAYALVMAFALVYSAEHYVFDILLGWLLTGVVSYAFERWERRRAVPPADAPPVDKPRRRFGRAVDGRRKQVDEADTLDGSLLTRP